MPCRPVPQTEPLRPIQFDIPYLLANSNPVRQRAGPPTSNNWCAEIPVGMLWVKHGEMRGGAFIWKRIPHPHCTEILCLSFESAIPSRCWELSNRKWDFWDPICCSVLVEYRFHDTASNAVRWFNGWMCDFTFQMLKMWLSFFCGVFAGASPWGLCAVEICDYLAWWLYTFECPACCVSNIVMSASSVSLFHLSLLARWCAGK